MKNGLRSGSWQNVAPWYNRVTERGQGHYYHQHVVIPGVIKLLNLDLNSKLLDLACGNGVMAKSIPKGIEYLGVDIAPSLINEAKRTDRNPNHRYLIADITKTLPLRSPALLAGKFDEGWTHAAIILALQNISNPVAVLQNISNLLILNSKLIIVLNHPAFRIPRQSSWGIDEGRKIQYRRVDCFIPPTVGIPSLLI